MERQRSKFSIISSEEHPSSTSADTTIIKKQINEMSDSSTTRSSTIENIRKNYLQTTQRKMTESFIIVWLCSDANDSVADSDDFVMQLRHVMNAFHIFTEINECMDFVTDVSSENIVMIINDYFDLNFLFVLDDIPQLHAIYIFDQDPQKHPQFTKDFKIVKGTYSQIEDICNAVKQDAHRLVVNLTPISIISPGSSFSLDELDPSFMYTQLLKEIIIDIEYDAKKAREEFIQFCLNHLPITDFHPNDANEFQRYYEDRSPIWWYTAKLFLYSSVNKALRTQDVELIMKMGFFVQDLHREIERQHSHAHQTSTIVVYRGQALSNNDFEKLRRGKGGLFSFNNFLSTSLDRAVSFLFADSYQEKPEATAVLFRMEIDPTISSTPFVEVKDIGQFKEEEILFSMHTVFRIGDMNQLDARLWEVNLTLTADNDEELKCLTDYIRNEIDVGDGWLSMALLMFKVGKFEKAIEISNMLPEKMSEGDPERLEIAQTLIDSISGMAQHSLGNYSATLTSLKKSLQLYQKFRADDYLPIANLFCNIGLTYQSMGDFPSALTNYEKALENQQQSLPSNSVLLAKIYNNIAFTHQSMGSFSSALTYLEKAIEIQEKCLPSNHPDLATTYSNIGLTHRSLGNYSAASSCFEKTLQIQQKVLPLDHPHMAITHNNIATVYVSMGSFLNALAHLEKALEIQQKSLPPNLPDLAVTLNNMGVVQQSMNDYPAALSNQEKVLEICQKTLPSDHPNLAAGYFTIGSTHQLMGNYPTAQSYYEKALQIQQKSLPTHHPDMIRTQNGIASLSLLNQNPLSGLLQAGRAFENQQRFLSVNHLLSPADGNNVDEIMEAFSEMSSNAEKLMEMQQKLVPSDGSTFTVTDQNRSEVQEFRKIYRTGIIGVEKFLQLALKSPTISHPSITGTEVDRTAQHQMIDHSLTAISQLKKALEVQPKSSSATDEEASHNNDETDLTPVSRDEFLSGITALRNASLFQHTENPPNDVSLSMHYNNIGESYYSMKDYSNALASFEKALDHLQKCSPINQQLLAKTQNNIAKTLDGLGRYREAFEIALSTLGSDHPETKVYRDHLDQL